MRQYIPAKIVAMERKIDYLELTVVDHTGARSTLRVPRGMGEIDMRIGLVHEFDVKDGDLVIGGSYLNDDEIAAWEKGQLLPRDVPPPSGRLADLY